MYIWCYPRPAYRPEVFDFTFLPGNSWFPLKPLLPIRLAWKALCPRAKINDKDIPSTVLEIDYRHSSELYDPRDTRG